MPIVNMKDMLEHAYHHGYAIAAFDLVSLDFLLGIMAAAEQTHAPVIYGRVNKGGRVTAGFLSKFSAGINKGGPVILICH